MNKIVKVKKISISSYRALLNKGFIVIFVK